MLAFHRLAQQFERCVNNSPLREGTYYSSNFESPQMPSGAPQPGAQLGGGTFARWRLLNGSEVTEGWFP